MSGSSKKRTYTFPADVVEKIEGEARKRLIETNKVGTRLLGSFSRDIICVCIQKALRQVKDMNLNEYKRAVKEATGKQKV